MIIRLLGIVIGLLLLLASGLLMMLTLTGKGGAQTLLLALGVFAPALAILGYGVGGQKFLRRYFPKFAEKEPTEQQSHNPFL